MSNERIALGWSRPVLIVCVVLCVVGCGTNKFEQELTIEDSSVKFAREAVAGQYAILSTAEVKKLRDEGADLLLLDAMPAASSSS